VAWCFAITRWHIFFWNSTGWHCITVAVGLMKLLEERQVLSPCLKIFKKMTWREILWLTPSSFGRRDVLWWRHGTSSELRMYMSIITSATHMAGTIMVAVGLILVLWHGHSMDFRCGSLKFRSNLTWDNIYIWSAYSIEWRYVILYTITQQGLSLWSCWILILPMGSNQVNYTIIVRLMAAIFLGHLNCWDWTLSVRYGSIYFTKQSTNCSAFELNLARGICLTVFWS
jgi:hypothetical protein